MQSLTLFNIYYNIYRNILYLCFKDEINNINLIVL